MFCPGPGIAPFLRAGPLNVLLNLGDGLTSVDVDVEVTMLIASDESSRSIVTLFSLRMTWEVGKMYVISALYTPQLWASANRDNKYTLHTKNALSWFKQRPTPQF